MTTFKYLLLQNHWANFKETLHKHPLIVEDNSRCFFFSNEGPRLSERGDNREIIKINWQLLKIFFSRTSGPISPKLGSEHLWVKGIQVYSNEGSRPSQRGDNCEIVKIHSKLLKIFFPEPLIQLQPNLAQSILWWRGFKFIQMKGHTLLKEEIIVK